MNERPALFMPADELFVELGRFFGKQSDGDFDPSLTQTLKSLPRDEGIWIFNRAYDPLNSCVDQGFRARRRLAVMVVRLK